MPDPVVTAAPATPPAAPETPPAGAKAQGATAPKAEQKFTLSGAPIESKEAPDEPLQEQEDFADEDADTPSGKVVSEAGDEEAVEEEADGEAGEEGGEDSTLGDDDEIDIDGEPVKFSQLKEAYKLKEKAERLHAVAKESLQAIGDKEQGEYALLDVLTQVNGGDRNEGYNQLVDMTARINQLFLADDDIPASIKASAIAIVERLRELKNLQPHERELRKVKRENETLAQSLEREKQERAKVAYDYEVRQYRERFNVEIPQAFQAAGIPLNDDTFEAFREIFSAERKKNPNATTPQVVAVMKKRFEVLRRAALSSANATDIPDEVKERIRRDEINKAKNRVPTNRGPMVGASQERRIFLPTRNGSF